MQMSKICFCHFLASWHLILKILIPSPIIDGELLDVGPEIMKIDALKPRNGKTKVCLLAFLLLHPLGQADS
jgi:hypothetical protein